MWVGPVISNERCVICLGNVSASEAFGSYCSLACVSCVNKADETTSSDEEEEHNAWNLFLDVVAQYSPGMRVESFLEDKELARTVLSCHLSMDLFCKELHAFLG